MDKDQKTSLILVTLIVVAVLAALLATFTYWGSRFPFARRQPLPPPTVDIEFFYIAQTVVSTINVTLSIFLLLTYVSIYRKTKSEFTIGLMIFSLIFLMNAVASNPLFIRAFGYQPVGLGPFAFLPDVFTTAALIVLLYLSIKY
jgi:hypothetical protein